MANWDSFTITCENREVLEALKREKCVNQDEIEEHSDNEIWYEANAAYAYDMLKAVSADYPESIIKAKISMEANYHTRKYFVTYSGGKDVVNDIKLSYLWSWPCNAVKGPKEITDMLEAFFAKIDTVTEKDGELMVDENEDKEITITMPIGENRRVTAKKQGCMVDVLSIQEKKTVTQETWEDVKPDDEFLPF